MLLRERVDEIALRRATGATALQIGTSILLQSVISSVVAACAATLMAAILIPIAAGVLFSDVPLRSAAFPYATAALAIVVSGLAGLAGGLLPAVHAARMDIADVMRA